MAAPFPILLGLMSRTLSPWGNLHQVHFRLLCRAPLTLKPSGSLSQTRVKGAEGEAIAQRWGVVGEDMGYDWLAGAGLTSPIQMWEHLPPTEEGWGVAGLMFQFLIF